MSRGTIIGIIILIGFILLALALARSCHSGSESQAGAGILVDAGSINSSSVSTDSMAFSAA